MKFVVTTSIALVMITIIAVDARTPQSRGQRPNASPAPPHTEESTETLPPGNIAPEATHLLQARCNRQSIIRREIATVITDAFWIVAWQD